MSVKEISKKKEYVDRRKSPSVRHLRHSSPLSSTIKSMLPAQLDVPMSERLCSGFHYILKAFQDFTAAKALLKQTQLFPQIIFNFEQASEKLMKALLFILKPAQEYSCRHHLRGLSRQLEDLNITLFKRVTAMFEHLGLHSDKDKDFRSLAVRCRYPQTNTLPLELFTLVHAQLAEKYTVQIAKHVFVILHLLFKMYSDPGCKTKLYSILLLNNLTVVKLAHQQVLQLTIDHQQYDISFS